MDKRMFEHLPIGNYAYVLGQDEEVRLVKIQAVSLHVGPNWPGDGCIHYHVGRSPTAALWQHELNVFETPSSALRASETHGHRSVILTSSSGSSFFEAVCRHGRRRWTPGMSWENTSGWKE